jgi:hypothetical protein
MTVIPRELIRVGRHQSSPYDAEIAQNVLRGYIGDPTVPKSTWFHTMKFRGGKAPGSNVTARPIVYASGSVPGSLVQSFNTVSVTNAVGENAAGVIYSSSPDGVEAFMGSSGSRYGFVVHARVGFLIVKMSNASDISGFDEKFYERTGYSSSTPPNPSGMSSIGTQGHMQIWLEGDANVSPVAPINVSPSGSVFSTTPTILASFRDQNGSYGDSVSPSLNVGDYMVQCRIEVQRKLDQVEFWDHTYTVSPAERDANQSSRVYGNGGGSTALVRGTVYQVRVSHADRFGSWGPASSWIDFTPVALGSMVVTSPSTDEKVDDLTPNVGFTWNHVDSLGMNQVRALFYRSGSLIETSVDYALSVAAGASSTFNWSNMGIATALLPGQVHSVKIQGRDTNSIWSALSPEVRFFTDAAPGVPTNLSPSGGVILPSSSYPVLTCKCVDSDDADPIVKAEILTGAGSLISTRTMSLVGGSSDTYQYQTTGSDLASEGDFKFRCYSGDGYLWSGGVESEGSATRSSEALFSWASVPAVSVTDPVSSGSISDASPTVSWTVTDQDKFRVRIIDTSDDSEVYSSGPIVDSVSRSWPIAAGYVRNGEIYDFEVGVEDDSLWGYGLATNVEVAYIPPPSPANLLVVPGVVGDEIYATYADISWDPYEGSDFNSYVIRRVGLERPLVRITTQEESHFQDHHAPSLGAVYEVVTVINAGIDELVASEEATGGLGILGIQGVCMVSLANPTTERFVSRQWSDIEFSLTGIEEDVMPRGATAPLVKRGSSLWHEGEVSIPLVPELGNPEEMKSGIEALARSRGFSYRDRNGFRLFCRIPAGSLSISRDRGGRYEAEFDLVQVMYIEGVE